MAQKTTTETPLIDIIEDEYKRATNSGQMIRKWTEFFNKFQKLEKPVSPDGKQTLTKSYIEQIKNMASKSALVYLDKLDAEDVRRINDDEIQRDSQRIGRTIFELDYNDLVEAKTDVFGLYDYDDPDDKEEIKARETEIKVLCFEIRYYWDRALAHIRDAVYNILKKYNKHYADEIKEEIFVAVLNFELTKPIREVNSKDLDKFQRFVGLISQYDDQASFEIKSKAFRCLNCDNITRDSNGKPPKKCLSCEGTSFEEDITRRRTEDFMYFVLQENVDALRPGQMTPLTVNVAVNGTDFVRSVYNIMRVGLHIAVNGIPRLIEISKSNTNIATYEVECYGIEIIDTAHAQNRELRELVTQSISPDRMDEHYEKLKRSIAPHLQGLENPKEAILIQLAGSPPLYDQNGKPIRSEINNLLFGEPSTGKSELLIFAANTLKGSQYVQGPNATKVGLTASIKETEVIRGGFKLTKKALDAGVYGLVRRESIVCFDELDKVRSDEHYEAMGTAIDDHQFMYVHKNAVHTAIKVYCGTLAAANPVTNRGKYDDTRDPISQSNFYHFVWDRFDFHWKFKKRRTDESRHMLWKHRAQAQANLVVEKDYIEGQSKYRLQRQLVDQNMDSYSQEYLSYEIAYLRSNYNPILKPNSIPWIMMMKFWNKYNQQNMYKHAEKEGEKMHFTPLLDDRAINTIIRTSQAVARLHRRNEVTIEDMDITLNLVRESVGQFIPRLDTENEDMITEARTTVLLQHGIREAAKIANQEHLEKYKKFRQGLQKTINYLDALTWRFCTKCHGKGHLDENSPEYINKHIPCTECNGKKGYYEAFMWHFFEREICAKAGTAVNAQIYFKLLKSAKFIVKGRNQPQSRYAGNELSGYWVSDVDLKSNVIFKLMDQVNQMFDIEAPRAMAPPKSAQTLLSEKQ